MLAAAAFAAADVPSVVLRGEITRKDYQTYKLLPFNVPEGTTRITIDFSYTGKEKAPAAELHDLMVPDGPSAIHLLALNK